MLSTVLFYLLNSLTILLLGSLLGCGNRYLILNKSELLTAIFSVDSKFHPSTSSVQKPQESSSLSLTTSFQLDKNSFCSTFKLCPESYHFTPWQLPLPWSTPPSFLAWIIAVAGHLISTCPCIVYSGQNNQKLF